MRLDHYRVSRLEAFGATAAELTGAAQLGYFTSGGMTIVRASTDANAAAEVEIQLTGTKTLTEGDFRP